MSEIMKPKTAPPELDEDLEDDDDEAEYDDEGELLDSEEFGR